MINKNWAHQSITRVTKLADDKSNIGVKFRWKNYSKPLKLFKLIGFSFVILLCIPTALELRSSLNIWLLILVFYNLGFSIAYSKWYNREREAWIQTVGRENVKEEVSRNKQVMIVLIAMIAVAIGALLAFILK